MNDFYYKRRYVHMSKKPNNLTLCFYIFLELVSDPTGLQEFTNYLKKEYSHENIRFWMAVNDLRRSAYSQITVKVKNIYE
jgi:Regulator of G protein signaling domain